MGPPYFNLTFGPIMAVALVVLPLGPLLAWKRGDALGALQRLWTAAAAALAAGLAALLLVRPGGALAAAGATLGVWLIGGALAEAAERIRLGRASLAETGRRAAGLPRGAWGTTLAHLGVGVFVLGACVETAGKSEAARVLAPGGRLEVGGYVLTLQEVRAEEGPNYFAERAIIAVVQGSRPVCTVRPQRRLYPAAGQTTSEVALCTAGLSDVYVVLGERREQGWLVRAYWNPLAKLIFLGPLLIAIGGLLSLSDRRLRIGAPGRARRPVQTAPAE